MPEASYSKSPIRIVIVDDHNLISDGISAHTERIQGFVVQQVFQNGLLFTTQLPGLRFDLLLCDVNIPGRNGFSVCRECKQQFPDRKVIFFTGYTESIILEEVKSSRADGFVPKDTGMDVLFDTIQDVLKGKRVFRFDLLSKQSFSHEEPGFVVEGNQRVSNSFERFQSLLSPREKEIMALYAQGMKDNEISSHLQVSMHTVHTFRKRIYQKMEVSSMQELMIACWQCGLM